MRRVGVVVLVATVGYFALAAPVAAQPDANLNREVTGAFTGTQSFEFGGGCSFVHQVYDATYQPARPGLGSVHVDVCVEPGGGDFVVDGTFQLTTRTGATVTGTVAGTVTPDEGGFTADLDFTLTVAQGTRQFQHATGTVTLDGVWNVGGPIGDSIEGTLSGALQR